MLQETISLAQARQILRRIRPFTEEIIGKVASSHKDSSANLVRRAKRMEQEPKSFKNRLAKLEKEILKTEHQG